MSITGNPYGRHVLVPIHSPGPESGKKKMKFGLFFFFLPAAASASGRMLNAFIFSFFLGHSVGTVLELGLGSIAQRFPCSKYKRMQGVSGFRSGYATVPSCLRRFRFCPYYSSMRLFHPFALSILPFLLRVVTAIPLADEPQTPPSITASHGITIPIAKRRGISPPGPFVERSSSSYASQARNSVA
jgi:hypothetical protein